MLRNLINAIYACHDGVVRMIPAYPDVVETSSNLAIIDIENGKASLKILARSSREDMKDYIVKSLESCFNMAGMKVETAGSYGGWDPNPESGILHHLLKIYKELNGEDGIIQVDHAGLECSVASAATSRPSPRSGHCSARPWKRFRPKTSGLKGLRVHNPGRLPWVLCWPFRQSSPLSHRSYQGCPSSDATNSWASPHFCRKTRCLSL